MNLRPLRRAGIAVAAAALLAAGIAGANPASAATTTTLNLVNSSGGSNTCTSPNLFYNQVITSLPQPQAGDTITINILNTNNTCDEFKMSWTDYPAGGGSIITYHTGSNAQIQSHTFTSAPIELKFEYRATSSSNLTVIQTFTYASPAGGASEAGPAVLAALSLGDSTTCSDGQTSGYVGTWITTPTTCNVTGKPAGANLLGWSTTPSFPVAIAQRQATNKWGTYELFDETGIVSAVFIPAGWQAFVTGANTLYPIWAK